MTAIRCIVYILSTVHSVHIECFKVFSLLDLKPKLKTKLKTQTRILVAQSFLQIVIIASAACLRNTLKLQHILSKN